MLSPIACRSLMTIHDTLQSSSSTSPVPGPVHTPSTHNSHKRLLSGILITLNILLILLLYFWFYKYFFRKRPSLSSSHHHSTATTNTPDPSPPTSPRAGHALELHVLNSIPLVEFRSISTAEKAPECAVCLAELNDGDRIRVLPLCNHCFHVDCIDTWFRSHANCPLCRTPVEEKAGLGSESMV